MRDVPGVAGNGRYAANDKTTSRALRINVLLRVYALGAEVGESVDDEGAEELCRPGTPFLGPGVGGCDACQGSETLP